MRTIISLRSSLATAALCAAAVSPAAAQRAAMQEYVRPVVQHAALTAETDLLRTVAVYQFTASRDASFPAQVTVADSAGRLVASFRLPGASASRPMMVDVPNDDLVLQGETPSGMLTLVFYRPGAPETVGAVVGIWSLNDKHGELRELAAR